MLAKEGYALLDEARMPHYKSPVRCGRAMVAVSWYAEAKRRNEAQRNEKPLTIEKPSARQALTGRTADIAEYEAKRILAEYGIPVTKEALATTRRRGAGDREAHRLSRRDQSAVARHLAQDRSESGEARHRGRRERESRL